MLRQDSILLGIGVGLFFFVTMFFAFHELNEFMIGREMLGRIYGGVRPQFVAVLGVVSNIIPFVVYQKAHKDRSMRGVGIITILLAFGVVVYYNILGG